MSARAGGVALRDELVERVLSLPLGNQAALAQVAWLCDQPTASAQGVAYEASHDESLTALILKLANSAFAMSVGRVGDLPTAVARLGFRLVQSLALSATGLRLLASTRDGHVRTRHELHRHAVRTALVARLLVPRGVEPEHALTAGLLHNLGLHVLSLYAVDEFSLLVDAAAAGEQLAPFEEEQLGFTHAELGALVAIRWSFPVELVAAIRDHDSPRPETALAASVQLADLIVRRHGIGMEAPAPIVPLRHEPAIGLAHALERAEVLLAAQERVEVHDESAPTPTPQPTPEQAMLSALGAE